MWDLFDRVVIYTMIVIIVVVPVATLLLVRRRSGNWRRAIRACALVSTFGNFLIIGTLCYVQAALPELIRGPTGSTALMTAFPAGGLYGMLNTLMLLPFSLLLVGLWRALHRQSFEAFIRPSSRAVTHEEEATR